jgi:outer membrane protein assembly factor BamB
VHDGTVYVPAKGHLHAVDLAGGTERWTVPDKRATFKTPAVGADAVYSFALFEHHGDDINDYLFAIEK